MKKGAVVLVRGRESPASKSRPCVIVQRTSTLESAARIVACPLTTVLRGPNGGRPHVNPSAENGLLQPSEIEFDWIHGFSPKRIVRVLGQMEPQIGRAHV